MRISDWSSDVCSSDLTRAGRKRAGRLHAGAAAPREGRRRPAQAPRLVEPLRLTGRPPTGATDRTATTTGPASRRGRFSFVGVLACYVAGRRLAAMSIGPGDTSAAGLIGT